MMPLIQTLIFGASMTGTKKSSVLIKEALIKEQTSLFVRAVLHCSRMYQYRM